MKWAVLLLAIASSFMRSFAQRSVVGYRSLTSNIFSIGLTNLLGKRNPDRRTLVLIQSSCFFPLPLPLLVVGVVFSFLGGKSPFSLAWLIPVSIRNAARFAVGLPCRSAHLSKSSCTESGSVTKTFLLTCALIIHSLVTPYYALTKALHPKYVY